MTSELLKSINEKNNLYKLTLKFPENEIYMRDTDTTKIKVKN